MTWICPYCNGIIYTGGFPVGICPICEVYIVPVWYGKNEDQKGKKCVSSIKIKE